MADQTSARDGAIVSDERIRNALRHHIGRAINVDRSFTRAQLANDSGVNIHAIDGILSTDPAKHRRVSMEDGLSLAFTLGEPAIRSLLALFGWTGCPLGDEARLMPMMIAATAMQHLSTIATAAADGIIDHREGPACEEAADLIIATVRPLSSARGHL